MTNTIWDTVAEDMGGVGRLLCMSMAARLDSGAEDSGCSEAVSAERKGRFCGKPASTE